MWVTPPKPWTNSFCAPCARKTIPTTIRRMANPSCDVCMLAPLQPALHRKAPVSHSVSSSLASPIRPQAVAATDHGRRALEPAARHRPEAPDVPPGLRATSVRGRDARDQPRRARDGRWCMPNSSSVQNADSRFIGAWSRICAPCLRPVSRSLHRTGSASFASAGAPRRAVKSPKVRRELKT
jgi:hypothetical protein